MYLTKRLPAKVKVTLSPDSKATEPLSALIDPELLICGAINATVPPANAFKEPWFVIEPVTEPFSKTKLPFR